MDRYLHMPLERQRLEQLDEPTEHMGMQAVLNLIHHEDARGRILLVDGRDAIYRRTRQQATREPCCNAARNRLVPVPRTLHLLIYDYVPDMVERRVPHREAHLALIRAYLSNGRVVIAGALGGPPHTGLIAFRDATDAEAFAVKDPYVAAGLVRSRRVEPWNVVD